MSLVKNIEFGTPIYEMDNLAEKIAAQQQENVDFSKSIEHSFDLEDLTRQITEHMPNPDWCNENITLIYNRIADANHLREEDSVHILYNSGYFEKVFFTGEIEPPHIKKDDLVKLMILRKEYFEEQFRRKNGMNIDYDNRPNIKNEQDLDLEAYLRGDTDPIVNIALETDTESTYLRLHAHRAHRAIDLIAQMKETHDGYIGINIPCSKRGNEVDFAYEAIGSQENARQQDLQEFRITLHHMLTDIKDFDDFRSGTAALVLCSFDSLMRRLYSERKQQYIES